MARDARTTASLKERLADALLELLASRAYEDISISEITDLADVGRTTYYRHFTSKDDLLNYKFETIFADVLGGRLFQHPPKDHTQESIKQAFEEHLERLYVNRSTFETVYAAGLDYLLFRYMYRSTIEMATPEGEVDRYRVALHAAAAFAIIDQWISSGFSQNPEELSEMLTSQMGPPHAKRKCADEGE